MATPRPRAVRLAAAGAAVALAFGLPVLIVLSAVVDERWRPLVNTLLTVFTVVPFAAWFLVRRRPSPEPEPGPPSDG
jgi:predicted MFS family arabinose efflux permease